jgi:hypothetical protein
MIATLRGRYGDACGYVRVGFFFTGMIFSSMIMCKLEMS